MKVVNKKLIIGIISGLAIAISTSVLIPIIMHFSNIQDKNIILLNTANNFNQSYISNDSKNSNICSLINNLNYVKEYISDSVIIKQKKLKLSIRGGWLSKTAEKRKDKRTKESQLAWFNNNTGVGINRYTKQVEATIDNSTNNLNKENKNISNIISIIHSHPYTYQFYLNNSKSIIPNINFFISKPHSLNNFSLKTSNISNNIFSVNTNSTNLNNVSLSTEEDGVSAKALTYCGSSLVNAVFKKVTFNAKIITFDFTSNSYKFAIPTSKVIKSNKKSRILQKNKLFKTNNTELSYFNGIDLNNSLYFNLSRIYLSRWNSLQDRITPSIIVPIFPSILNKHSNVVSKATIKYKNIMTFKNNHSLYYSIIGGILLNSVVVIISYLYMVKVWRKRSIRISNLNSTTMLTELNNIDDRISNLHGTGSRQLFDHQAGKLYDELNYHESFINSKYFYFTNRRNTPEQVKIRQARDLLGAEAQNYERGADGHVLSEWPIIDPIIITDPIVSTVSTRIPLSTGATVSQDIVIPVIIPVSSTLQIPIPSEGPTLSFASNYSPVSQSTLVETDEENDPSETISIIYNKLALLEVSKTRINSIQDHAHLQRLDENIANQIESLRIIITRCSLSNIEKNKMLATLDSFEVSASDSVIRARQRIGPIDSVLDNTSYDRSLRDDVYFEGNTSNARTNHDLHAGGSVMASNPHRIPDTPIDPLQEYVYPLEQWESFNDFVTRIGHIMGDIYDLKGIKSLHELNKLAKILRTRMSNIDTEIREVQIPDTRENIPGHLLYQAGIQYKTNITIMRKKLSLPTHKLKILIKNPQKTKTKLDKNKDKQLSIKEQIRLICNEYSEEKKEVVCYMTESDQQEHVQILKDLKSRAKKLFNRHNKIDNHDEQTEILELLRLLD